ncbi:MAG: 3'-5' exonuclease [Bacteroidales bacterium]
MKDFAAIDFETANGSRTSVCSVGIVIVNNGQICHEYHSLIRPTPNFYSHFTTDIHGITFEDTKYERIFPNVWEEVAPLLEGLPLVAHNSPFDEGCLKAVFHHYAMPYPNYQFYCTLRASRKLHKGLLPNHQLQTVAAHCGYNLINHHHALADAQACAAIAIAIL